MNSVDLAQVRYRAHDPKSLADVTWVQQTLFRLLDEVEFHRQRMFGVGCHCDPPGSGEEWCVGTCVERVKVARLRATLQGVEWETRDAGGAYCIFCAEYQCDGHEEDCALAAMLIDTAPEGETR